MKQHPTPSEVISGLQYLLEESKAAKAVIDYSYATDRLQTKVQQLEERIAYMEEIFRKNNIMI